MQHAMQLCDERPRLLAGSVVRVCLCLALASAPAGCAFETTGTGEARTRRSGAFGPISEEPSAIDMSEAAQIAADRLRSLAQPTSNGQTDSAAPQPDSVKEPEPDQVTATAGSNADTAGEAGKSAGSPDALGLPVVPAGGGRVVPAADGGASALDESDAGDDSDAGAAPLAGASAPPPMAAGAGGTAGGAAEGEAGASGTRAANEVRLGGGDRGEMNGSGARGTAGRAGSSEDASDDDAEPSNAGGRGNGNGRR